MGPDEFTSREEFLIAVEYLMAELDHQRLILKQLIATVMSAKVISSAQVDAMADQIESAPEHERLETAFARLDEFEAMRSIVERYRGDLREDGQSSS
jgi:hypothetical protein